MNETKRAIISEIIANSNFKGDNYFEKGEEYGQDAPFSIRTLAYKIKDFSLPIKITALAYGLLGVYADNQSSTIQLMTLDVLFTIRTRKEKNICVNDIINTWPEKFPNPSDKQWEIKWNILQTSTKNLIDSKEYWESFLKEEENEHSN